MLTQNTLRGELFYVMGHNSSPLHSLP
jgi:hypothetical protein